MYDVYLGVRGPSALTDALLRCAKCEPAYASVGLLIKGVIGMLACE